MDEQSQQFDDYDSGRDTPKQVLLRAAAAARISAERAREESLRLRARADDLDRDAAFQHEREIQLTALAQNISDE